MQQCFSMLFLLQVPVSCFVFGEFYNIGNFTAGIQIVWKYNLHRMPFINMAFEWKKSQMIVGAAT
jgi:hypothetical protein